MAAQLSANMRAAMDDEDDKASVSTSASILSERRRLPTRCAHLSACDECQ